MAFKFQQASEGHSSNLALFTPKPVDAAINEVQFVEYRPVTQLSHGSPIEFNISGTGMEYLNLKDTRLHIDLMGILLVRKIKLVSLICLCILFFEWLKYR